MANYGSQVDRAQSTLDRAKIQYSSTKLSLDNIVSNAEAALIQSKQALVLAQKSVENTLKIQELSTTSQDMNRDTTLKSLQDTFATEKLNLLSLYGDVLTSTKNILGTEDPYDATYPSYYVGARDAKQREATFALYDKLKDTPPEVMDNPSNDQMLDALSVFSDTYNKLNTLLNSLETTVTNSLAGAVLPQTVINGYQASIDGMQASLIGNRKAFTAFQTNARDALASMDGDTIGLDLASESAQLNLETSRINGQNTLLNAEMAVDNAQRSYDQAVDNRTAQLRLLDNTVNDAKI